MWKALLLFPLLFISPGKKNQEPCMQRAEIKATSQKREIPSSFTGEGELKVMVGCRAADEDYPAFERIKILNFTDSTVVFPLQDDAVIFIREVEINPGEWMPVEYHFHSWCGNSYDNSIILEPGEMFHFITWRMSGREKVRMRYKIRVAGNLNVVYSNPFPGRINTCQTVLSEEDEAFLNDFIDFLD